MTLPELEQRIVSLCRESGLTDVEQLSAHQRAGRRLKKGIKAPQAKKSYAPLTRPSGSLMGKNRREEK